MSSPSRQAHSSAANPHSVPHRPRGYRRPVSKHRDPPPPSATPEHAATASKWETVVNNLYNNRPAATSPPAPPPTASPPTSSASTPPQDAIRHIHRKTSESLYGALKKQQEEEEARNASRKAAKWGVKMAQEKLATAEAEKLVKGERLAVGVEEGVGLSWADDVEEEGERECGEVRPGGSVWSLEEFMRMMRARYPEVRGRLVAGGHGGGAAEAAVSGAAGSGGERTRRRRAGRGRRGDRI